LEAAHLAPRLNPELAVLYEHEAAQSNRNQAAIAVARKLAAYLLRLSPARIRPLVSAAMASWYRPSCPLKPPRLLRLRRVRLQKPDYVWAIRQAGLLGGGSQVSEADPAPSVYM